MIDIIVSLLRQAAFKDPIYQESEHAHGQGSYVVFASTLSPAGAVSQKTYYSLIPVEVRTPDASYDLIYERVGDVPAFRLFLKEHFNVPYEEHEMYVLLYDISPREEPLN